AGWVRMCLFSPDGKRILSGGQDALAKVWDPATYEEYRSLEGHTDAVLAAAFSPNREPVATAGPDGAARLGNTATGELLHELREGHDFLASHAAYFARDGKQMLATSAGDGTIRLWNAKDQTQWGELPGTGLAAVFAVAPSNETIVTGSNDNAILVW